MTGKVRKTRWGWRIALLLIPAAAWVDWLQISRLGWLKWKPRLFSHRKRDV